ncbi:hypothetical protein DSO57_1033871 [Entomophthora muscae]|uniref:Uncharacterized protein n=1 Tax=Entomophthora muscae TaxID=34485 RepID=A0ACC2U910_9FUNG|nr:hypothetical protein DSO57_1033871 [Entomophthora muscae]
MAAFTAELHQVLVNNVHMVQASQEATKDFSKPYSYQLLDDATDTEPQHLGDATPLRGVNVAIPMETMKDYHPELCDSIAKFISTASNLDINLVQAITTLGPIYIVSFKLVQQMGLALDINNKKQYGTAGLDCTNTQGAYSTLPLRFAL